ncbi:MAG TPA: AAA family ATPase [Sphaerochaeta sp.]|nr:AAA family ATPase [Sphaerochaeta sp.]
MKLFSQVAAPDQPLAYRMRPRTLDEYVGQDAIIGVGRLLRRAIQADQLSSVIFYGPPGTGKTTLARVIANTTKRHFSTLNAVLSGVKELRHEIEAAKERSQLYGQGTILFVDEVHRWNKSQQDALLPWVENGTVILIGATTENPFFEVNAALVSRSRIFQLTALTEADLHTIAHQALADKERGYGAWKISFEAGALEHLVQVADGDARSLLNALELAVETAEDSFPPPPESEIHISFAAAQESIQKKAVLYDKEGDYHYDVISAFIKSIRGSDPDATLYWLARMVSAGEDPKYLFRRMLISASEDVGLADPNALTVVQAAADAFDRIGLPEGRFHLAQAALYLATTAKSNSAMGFYDALKAVEEEQREEVPNHLRDSSRDGKGFGHGKGYLYPHAYQDHWIAQQYLPASLSGRIFYTPSSQGWEASIQEQVNQRREEQLEAASADAFVENLTYSFDDSARQRWVRRVHSERSTMLRTIRDELYRDLTIGRNARIMVLNAGHGLLLWEAYRRNPEGLTVAQVRKAEEERHITHYSQTLPHLEQPLLYRKPANEVLTDLEDPLRFEVILGRNLFSRAKKEQALAVLLKHRLAPGGVIRLAETLPVRGSRLSDFVQEKEAALLRQAETILYEGKDNPLTNWEEEDLLALFAQDGYQVEVRGKEMYEQRTLTGDDIQHYLSASYLPALAELQVAVDPKELTERLTATLVEQALPWRSHILFLTVQKAE